HLVAARTGSARLADSANASYVHGMGLVLLVCGIAALVTALLAAALLPDTPTPRRTEGEDTPAVAPTTVDAGE
ncbi:MFS transporter, partial [Streptomyces sp. NPDC127079]